MSHHSKVHEQLLENHVGRWTHGCVLDRSLELCTLHDAKNMVEGQGSITAKNRI